LKLKPFLFSSLLSLLGLCSPELARAQFIGYTSPQTVTSQPFNATGCNGGTQSVAVPNEGQSAHYAFFQGSLISSLSVKLIASNDGATFFDISEIATGAGNGTGIVTGTGYYNVVKVAVSCNVGGSITVFYSGLSTTPGALFGGQLTSQLVKAVAFGVAANAGFNTAVTRSPFGNSGGSIYFKYAAAGPSGSTLTVQCSADENGSFASSLPNYSISTVSTQQVFPIPATSCPFYTVTYGSGGASATNFTAFYVFNEPGNFTNPPYQGTNITGTTATAIKATGGFLHTLTINTGGAGTIIIFDLGSAACTGTPATNQKATITAVAGTLQTFTYDMNFFNGICAKASVAMDYTISFN
jgi:hypothetical protein